MPDFFIKRYRLLLPLLAVLVLASCSGDSTPPPYAHDESAPPRTAQTRLPDYQRPLPATAPAFTPFSQAEEIKIALLLPLSGNDAALARSLLDAATLALYDKYSTLPAEDARARITLLPKDTRGTEEGARAAAKEALAEGAQLILGPLYSKLAQAILPQAKQAGVQVISFSNNPALSGSGLFQFGFMAEEQIERVVQHAWKHDYTAFATMAPETAYGKQAVQHYRKLIRTRSGKVHPLELYPSEATNLAYQTARMVRMMLKDNAGKQVLFLPERGKNLEAILSALLQKSDVLGDRHFKLLGTGLWDDPSSLKLRGLHGAWFASTPPRPYRRFEQRFSVTYGYPPRRIASLAYDAVALAATMALAPTGADFSAKALTLPGGYSGPAGGIFRFLANGICQRNLAILEITPDGLNTISAAPLSF